MARWGLCSGCVFGLMALVALIVALQWPEGEALWFGWGVVGLFLWGAIMSVYFFDRPAPPGRARRG
jgi:hypothetical protein